MAADRAAPVSVVRAGLACRCPNCGEGPLYEGLLSVRARCPACGFDLKANDAGDGPAVFVILILGFLVVALALIVEARYEPPLWVHVAIWPVFIVVCAAWMLRVLKASLIALQYRHRRDTFDAS